jgi:hypothetical protein
MVEARGAPSRPRGRLQLPLRRGGRCAGADQGFLCSALPPCFLCSALLLLLLRHRRPQIRTWEGKRAAPRHQRGGRRRRGGGLRRERQRRARRPAPPSPLWLTNLQGRLADIDSTHRRTSSAARRARFDGHGPPPSRIRCWPSPSPPTQGALLLLHRVLASAIGKGRARA